jgi:hypothetical protein
MKTKEQIKKYNQEYSKRPEVIERARIKNSRPDQRENRKVYKQTPAAKAANYRYRTKPEVKERNRRRRLELLYGITYEEYEVIRTAQKNACAICFISPERFHVDHNHETGKVRGLLCGSCNMALGLFKENETNLLVAVEYLRRYV